MRVKASFSREVYYLVKAIPKGKVASYGQIALLLGAPRAARAVGWVLHYCDTDDVPWYRVINSHGRISTTCQEHTKLLQKALLEAEGVMVNDEFMIDMRKHQWQPA